ncbi:MAG TPA: sel1 repeat family protein, partial [Leucothrix sp.]|nr:sel1 repeat family protein [Leucothrix sp.]
MSNILLILIRLLSLVIINFSAFATNITVETKACNAGDAVSCTNLGNAYAKGQGIKKDFEKAKTLYIKACKGGEITGCSNLG